MSSNGSRRGYCNPCGCTQELDRRGYCLIYGHYFDDVED